MYYLVLIVFIKLKSLRFVQHCTLLNIVKELGVNTITVEENVLLPEYYSQYNAKDVATSDLERGLVDVVEETEYRITVSAIDEATYERVYSNLVTKGIEIAKSPDNQYLYIYAQRPYKTLTQIGTGFHMEDMLFISDMGFEIVPELRTFTTYAEYGLETLITQLQQIPTLGFINFDGTRMPGYTEANLVQFIREQGFGYVEFYTLDQEGFITLSNKIKTEDNTYNIVRMFSPDKLSHIKATGITSTYELALLERNIKSFGFVMPKTGNAEESFEDLQDEVSAFIEIALEHGYTLGTNTNLKYWPNPSKWYLFVVGLGAIAMFIKLINLTPLAKYGLGYLAGAGGIAVFLGLLATDEVLALQCMAFLATIVFSSYGAILFLDPPDKPSMILALVRYLQVTIISLSGVVIMTALISGYNFAIGLDLFKGVKAAHVAPLAIVFVVIIISKWRDVKREAKEVLKINWKYLVVGGIVIAAIASTVLGIYISRTGNSTIPELELLFRNALDYILGVRPRTKEFLIGHPVMILGLYMTYRGFRWPALIVGTIGQVSMLNTFSHIHTPITISITRTVYGIGIGIVVGIIFMIGYKLVFKVINACIRKLGL